MKSSDGAASTSVPTIDLVYFNAGGGHRAAALALEASIRELGIAWQVRLVNLTEILDPKDMFRSAMGFAPEDFYNRRLAYGWTFGLAQELKILQGMIRLGHKPMRRALQRHWARTRPDMVVSLVPNFNRALYQSLAAARPGVPYVTVLTDMADYPPNFWIEVGQAQHLICGTPRAVAQARGAGYAQTHIHATSGMIIRPDFYRPIVADRRLERLEHGLDPQRVTGVVMFGGHGSRVMQSIARLLEDTQLILICGHNRRLAQKLRAMTFKAPRLILEFTGEIQRYMHMGDFFIGKPGPGSLSEAVQQQLPVIVVRNSWTMPQERYNTQWVRENNVGLVLPSFRLIRDAVTQLSARLPEFREAIGRIQNRAIFEVPQILAGILEAAKPVRLQVARSAGEDVAAGKVALSGAGAMNSG
jgi:UDP-N-acetylglucosamine:LPS N-acetylglucosamine transferase